MGSRYVRRLRERIGHELLLPSVTILLFDERDRLLLLRPSKRGLWVAPGGMIGPHEARLLGGDPRPDGAEVLEARYLALDELPALPLAEWLPVVPADAQQRRAER